MLGLTKIVWILCLLCHPDVHFLVRAESVQEGEPVNAYKPHKPRPQKLKLEIEQALSSLTSRNKSESTINNLTSNKSKRGVLLNPVQNSFSSYNPYLNSGPNPLSTFNFNPVPFQNVDKNPIHNFNSFPNLNPVQNFNLLPNLNPVQNFNSLPNLNPVQNFNSLPNLNPVQNFNSFPNLNFQSPFSTYGQNGLQNFNSIPNLNPSYNLNRNVNPIPNFNPLPNFNLNNFNPTQYSSSGINPYTSPNFLSTYSPIRRSDPVQSGQNVGQNSNPVQHLNTVQKTVNQIPPSNGHSQPWPPPHSAPGHPVNYHYEPQATESYQKLLIIPSPPTLPPQPQPQYDLTQNNQINHNSYPEVILAPQAEIIDPIPWDSKEESDNEVESSSSVVRVFKPVLYGTLAGVSLFVGYKTFQKYKAKQLKRERQDVSPAPTEVTYDVSHQRRLRIR